jgi:sulfur-oxidizing protein SoxZ
MTIAQPRVQAPRVVAKGDVFEVRTLISHPMETGLRRDASGQIIPRDIINTFTCHYDDVVVFSADLREAVAADPFLSFYVRAERSGRLRFTWLEDGGAVYALESPLRVEG